MAGSKEKKQGTENRQACAAKEWIHSVPAD
jgi:hypothetical protein